MFSSLLSSYSRCEGIAAPVPVSLACHRFNGGDYGWKEACPGQLEWHSSLATTEALRPKDLGREINVVHAC